MNQVIVDQYNISFENRILNFKFSGNKIGKIIHINNDVAGEFLSGWNDPEEINELLIPDIEAVLNGEVLLNENGSETVSIDIGPTEVVFYKKIAGSYPEIPTQDFLEIVKGWRDFLLQPPLNRSKP